MKITKVRVADCGTYACNIACLKRSVAWCRLDEVCAMLE